MKRTIRRTFGLGLLLSIYSVPSQALVIDLTYGAGFENDVQRNVVGAAAKWWEAAILTDFTVAITARQVDLSPKGATLLGAMSSNTQTAAINPVTGTRLPASGTVDIASNRLADFFFDPTPFESEEFNMNRRVGTAGDAIAGSDAALLFDALSVWIHEIGHVMGFSGASGNWGDGDPFFGYTDFINNLTFAGGVTTYNFDWLTGGTEGNSGDTMQLANVFHTSGGVIESNMNPFTNRGERHLLSPIDIDIVADAFHLRVDDTPSIMMVPEPSVFSLLIMGLAGGLVLRRRKRS